MYSNNLQSKFFFLYVRIPNIKKKNYLPAILKK